MNFATPELFSTTPIGQLLARQALDRLEAREGDEWRDDLMSLWPRFSARLASLGRAEFRIEEFREFALASGLREPVSHHAWGCVPRWLKGLVVATGRYESAQSARTHGHPVRVYRVLTTATE